jgi:hypothetical protein
VAPAHPYDLCDGVALDKAFRDGNDEVAGVIEAIGTAIDDEIGASANGLAVDLACRGLVRSGGGVECSRPEPFSNRRENDGPARLYGSMAQSSGFNSSKITRLSWRPRPKSADQSGIPTRMCECRFSRRPLLFCCTRVVDHIFVGQPRGACSTRYRVVLRAFAGWPVETGLAGWGGRIRTSAFRILSEPCSP